eukprot:6196708-Pleurochrysis_carterae.AAC.4
MLPAAAHVFYSQIRAWKTGSAESKQQQVRMRCLSPTKRKMAGDDKHGTPFGVTGRMQLHEGIDHAELQMHMIAPRVSVLRPFETRGAGAYAIH